ncbi:MAG: class I SAM-dependent methyltransferase [Actinomycetota bacterium]
MGDVPEEKKAWLAGVFDRAAPTYDLIGASYHAEFGRRLVERAPLIPGASVLDVACGTGAVLIRAAEVIGPQGHAVGTDISPEMVRLAVAESSRAGLSNCEALVMDAERLGFRDSSFDFLFCAFSIFFLPDPDRAADEFSRVLTPDGRLAISTWGDEDPEWEWEDELFGRLSVNRRPISELFSTRESLHALLDGAGFMNVSTDVEALDIRFANEEEWWAWKWSFSLRGVLEQLSEDALVALRVEAFERMRPLRKENGYKVRLTARFAFANAPVLC